MPGGQRRRLTRDQWMKHVRSKLLIKHTLYAAQNLCARAFVFLRNQAQRMEIEIDGLRSIEIASTAPPPFPKIDLTDGGDPVSAICGSPEFSEALAYFENNAVRQRALVSPHVHALLYSIVRNLNSADVIEIGVYKCATTEAIARAVAAGEAGTIHAVDPFRPAYVSEILSRWPPELFDRVRLHAADSVTFFATLGMPKIEPALVFVDGNHDYEFAYFDICSAARVLAPGGFLLVDNIAQPGPALAVQDFLAWNPGWIECGGKLSSVVKAYDGDRTQIPNTDLAILRAPRDVIVTRRPRSFGQTKRQSSALGGLDLEIRDVPTEGLLYAQVIVRGFGDTPAERIYESSALLRAGETGRKTLTFDSASSIAGSFTHYTEETCLSWQSDAPLRLGARPVSS
jgi:predicted O-methyltransferase YrrM